jgi:amino acid permease
MIIYEGTWVTASAHIVTTVIGSGVLSLAWAVAQLGWIGGTIALILFSLITLLTSILMADCYRYPDPIHGARNPTYMGMVKTILGNTLQISIFVKFEFSALNSFYLARID